MRITLIGETMAAIGVLLIGILSFIASPHIDMSSIEFFGVTFQSWWFAAGLSLIGLWGSISSLRQWLNL
ncbi:MAG: hypothetical protein FWE40_03855 [Oscillospiraceae bacterium]|nr:hypothetical protein [Oscillospiraceae bacterium]